MNFRISVIVPTLGRLEIVKRFIVSLNAQTTIPLELIIVDASPQNQELTYRDVLRAEIQLRFVSSQPGLTHQRNVGVQNAKGDFIFFFDDDIVLEPTFIEQCLREFMKPANERVGVVYGTITNLPPPVIGTLPTIHQGIVKLLCRFFYLPRNGNGRFQASGMPTFVIGRQSAQHSQCMPGGLTAFRKEVFRDFSFDERLTGYSYMEDDDAGKRISSTFDVVYSPNARCAHLHAAPARINNYRAGIMLMINHHYLFRKNFTQTFYHRFAHFLSLIGYPLLQLWDLNFSKLAGAVHGLFSIIFKKDELSRVSF